MFVNCKNGIHNYAGGYVEFSGNTENAAAMERLFGYVKVKENSDYAKELLLKNNEMLLDLENRLKNISYISSLKKEQESLKNRINHTKRMISFYNNFI